MGAQETFGHKGAFEIKETQLEVTGSKN
jgi:hypothetical protein